MHTLEQALSYWHRRYETSPEPQKSFAREHLEQLLMIQDGESIPESKEKQ